MFECPFNKRKKRSSINLELVFSSDNHLFSDPIDLSGQMSQSHKYCRSPICHLVEKYFRVMSSSENLAHGSLKSITISIPFRLFQATSSFKLAIQTTLSTLPRRRRFSTR